MHILASIRILAGYRYTGKYGGTPVMGFEFGMVDLIYLNGLIDMERDTFYVTLGVDVLGLLKMVKMMRDDVPRRRKRRDPTYTSPDGRTPSEKADVLPF